MNTVPNNSTIDTSKGYNPQGHIQSASLPIHSPVGKSGATTSQSSNIQVRNKLSANPNQRY